jgi:hypothetical protein
MQRNVPKATLLKSSHHYCLMLTTFLTFINSIMTFLECLFATEMFKMHKTKNKISQKCNRCSLTKYKQNETMKFF